MKLKNVIGILLSLCTLVIVGCGGGGGSSAPVSTTVSGQAQKGPIIGGDVKIYAIDANGVVQATPLATTPATVTTRLPFGNYSAVIGYAGPVKVVVAGNPGSIYKDEATGTDVSFAGKSLSALVANVSGNVKVSITPLTELAVRKAVPPLTPAGITAANTGVANAMGLQGVDIVSVSPSTSTAYQFALAVLSQAAGTGATGLSDLLTQIAPAIDIATGSITDPAVNTIITNATTAAFNNPNNAPIINPPGGGTPGADGTAVSGISLTSPSNTAEINTPVVFSATVTKVSGGAVADGTPVTFTTSAGTIAATVNTVGGVAAATLSGITTPQSVTVTAKAGSHTSTKSVGFFDPNVPASVTVTSNPTTAFLGASVTISAAVTRAAGGAVPNGTVVSFTTSAGTITASTTTTGGIATATLSGINTAQTVNVTATAGTVTSAPAPVTFVANPNLPGGITIAAVPTTLFAGQGSSTITATVTPAGQGGVIANGTVVTFATTVGTITASATTTNGVATATLTSAAVGTASVTATVSGITSTPASVLINALPIRAIVKLATSGTLPPGAVIDGMQFILNYATNKGLSIVGSGIVASGFGTASLIINNVNVNGVVNSAFANPDLVNNLFPPVATQTGEFATLTFTITGATPPFPALADFTIASSNVGTTPILATPLTVTVLSVTLQ